MCLGRFGPLAETAGPQLAGTGWPAAARSSRSAAYVDRTTCMSPEHHIATTGQRLAAYLVDLLVLGPPLAAVLARLEADRRLRRGGGLVLLVANGYHVVFEGSSGRTPGKRATGIEVVREDGRPCTYRAATVRTLARFLDVLPVGYLAALVSMAVTKRRQRLGDLLAGTVVVDRGASS